MMEIWSAKSFSLIVNADQNVVNGQMHSNSHNMELKGVKYLGVAWGELTRL